MGRPWLEFHTDDSVKSRRLGESNSIRGKGIVSQSEIYEYQICTVLYSSTVVSEAAWSLLNATGNKHRFV